MAYSSVYQGLSQGVAHGAAMAGATAAPAVTRRDPHGRLPVPVPVPVALLTITGLSAGLWLGIVWLAATLL